MHPLAWIAAGVAAVGALLFARRAQAADDGPDDGARIVIDDQGRAVPRGFRNNNPFNLRPIAGTAWRGQVGIDDGNYLRFETLAAGLRAGMVNLRNQQRRHQLASVRDIITKYAPAADNNDTAAYIAAVCRELGVTDAATLNLITSTDTLAAFGGAVVFHENGQRAHEEDLHVAALQAMQS